MVQQSKFIYEDQFDGCVFTDKQEAIEQVVYTAANNLNSLVADKSAVDIEADRDNVLTGLEHLKRALLDPSSLINLYSPKKKK